MFQHLDTAIAFVVLMLVASLCITAATQLVVSLLGLRGANLRRSLVDLFETACPDQEAGRWAKEIAGRVLRHAAISESIFSRFPLRPDRIPYLRPETAGKLQGAAASIPLLPWIAGGAGGFFVTPIVVVIAKHLFAADLCKYSDILASYVSAINFCQHPWRTGALVGAILGGLFSRWRLATSIRVEELLVVLEKLSDPFPGTLPDPAQRAMLTIAWAENEAGAKAKQGAAKAARAVYAKANFDEGIARRVSKAVVAESERFAPAAADFDEGIVRHAEPVEAEGSVAVAVEKATAQQKSPEPESTPVGGVFTAMLPAPVAAAPEPRREGLRAWFDRVMERGSQRFTVEARVVTVVLCCVFVFAAHFDSVRLFQSMSEGAELRAQLTASAVAVERQAEKLSRSNEGVHTVVPDVYRKAMASVLRALTPVLEPPKEPAKPKGHRGSHTAAPSSSNSQQPADTSLSIATAEDKATVEAKAKATRALEGVPGFASREDAESWLRATLDGNPASESLAAAYGQELNGELASDSDKLIDESASLKSGLARSEFKLFRDGRGGGQSSNEVPGLLISVALLSLGAAFWYNTLKSLASLRPQLAMRQDRERKDEKLRD